MQKQGKPKAIRKPQSQPRPGLQSKMKPVPNSEPSVHELGKLNGKVALITGGDSGIGRAVAQLFAQQGAKISIAYLSEDSDAMDTAKAVENYTECLMLPGDLSKEKHCRQVIDKTLKKFGQLDILVNNAGTQWEQPGLEEISTEQLLKTFSTNFFPFVWLCKFAIPHLKPGSSIINTSSVTAFRGSDTLIDYSSTKGAIVAFTRSLSSNLVKKGIRVNGVAPGPIWTPLIVSSFAPKKSAKFGSEVPMERAGEPSEVAPSYLFLASDDSSYMTGQFLHPNGGEVVNG